MLGGQPETHPDNTEQNIMTQPIQPNQVLLRPDRLVGADLNAWLAAGGGSGLQNALAAPGQIAEILEEAGLCGMGGAGFPTHRKWTAMAQSPSVSGSRYVVCNANEDEPGTFKDRFLLERAPHQVIEGALIAAVYTRADHIVLYINPHLHEALAAAREAVGQWQQHELFRRAEAHIGRPLDIRVTESSGRYIGGEETAVISWLNGGFPFPQYKPPYPFQKGVAGEPTLLNNTETLAHVPHILREGAAWYRALGRAKGVGTKLYSLSGDVLNPGLYELPMGITLRELVEGCGGGMLEGRTFKAVFTGGPSNNLLTGKDLDVPLDFASVKERQSGLGTGAMIVISEGTSVVRKVSEYIRFFADNSCGQCPPCKGGTYQLARLVSRVDEGISTADDLRALKNLVDIMPGAGRCGLITGAATVVASSMRTFPIEYGLPEQE